MCFSNPVHAQLSISPVGCPCVPASVYARITGLAHARVACLFGNWQARAPCVPAHTCAHYRPHAHMCCVPVCSHVLNKHFVCRGNSARREHACVMKVSTSTAMIRYYG